MDTNGSGSWTHTTVHQDKEQTVIHLFGEEVKSDGFAFQSSIDRARNEERKFDHAIGSHFHEFPRPICRIYSPGRRHHPFGSFLHPINIRKPHKLTVLSGWRPSTVHVPSEILLKDPRRGLKQKLLTLAASCTPQAQGLTTAGQCTQTTPAEREREDAPRQIIA